MDNSTFINISTFEIPDILKAKLIASGYRFLHDFDDIGPAQLARETDLTTREALDTLKLLRQYRSSYLSTTSTTTTTTTSSSSSSSSSSSFTSLPPPSPSISNPNQLIEPNSTTTSTSSPSPLPGKTALELLQQERLRHGAVTTCHELLDEMLGGGVPLGQLTEFCGVPGIGKTQVSMQLALDVAIPAALGGLGGRCVYIDTEGSFSIERVVEMAAALVHHFAELNVGRDAELGVGREVELDVGRDAELDVEYFLSRIMYYRVHDYIEQLALINVLPTVFASVPDIKLVVLDSVTFHFRHSFDSDFAMRTRILNGSAHKLMALASKHCAAVVLINQVTTKFAQSHDANDGSSPFSIVPALGDSWGHMCTNRIILFWKHHERHAYLYKSPARKATTCAYQVVAEGIRGVE